MSKCRLEARLGAQQNKGNLIKTLWHWIIIIVDAKGNVVGGRSKVDLFAFPISPIGHRGTCFSF